MEYTRFMPFIFRCVKAQAMVETAFALPVLVLLLAGCVQVLQIAVAHIVVLDAAYEANRQYVLDQRRAEGACRTAQHICRALGPGVTEYSPIRSQVTHYLKPLFPMFSTIKIQHDCMWFVFSTEATGQAAP